jgi:hypothetical protein
MTSIAVWFQSVTTLACASGAPDASAVQKITDPSGFISVS